MITGGQLEKGYRSSRITIVIIVGEGKLAKRANEFGDFFSSCDLVNVIDFLISFRRNLAQSIFYGQLGTHS